LQVATVRSRTHTARGKLAKYLWRWPEIGPDRLGPRQIGNPCGQSRGIIRSCPGIGRICPDVNPGLRELAIVLASQER
jgi:hypothetical protein